MNELEKARSIEVSGEVRQKILERYNSQIARWNIAVPETEPLVLDFGLGRFESVGVVECWIANEIEAGYCGKYLFLFNGQTCPMHYHKNKHETFFLMEGGLRVILNGKQIDLKKAVCL
jgi:D-lyxose ketol-isomerase